MPNRWKWYLYLGLSLLASRVVALTAGNRFSAMAPSEGFIIPALVSMGVFLLNIGIPFLVVLIVALEMPRWHSERTAAYSLFLGSLPSAPVTVVVGFLVDRFVLGQDVGFGVPATYEGLVAVLNLVLRGLPVFFLGFTAYILGSWLRQSD